MDRRRIRAAATAIAFVAGTLAAMASAVAILASWKEPATGLLGCGAGWLTAFHAVTTRRLPRLDRSSRGHALDALVVFSWFVCAVSMAVPSLVPCHEGTPTSYRLLVVTLVSMVAGTLLMGTSTLLAVLGMHVYERSLRGGTSLPPARPLRASAFTAKAEASLNAHGGGTAVVRMDEARLRLRGRTSRGSLPDPRQEIYRHPDSC